MVSKYSRVALWEEVLASPQSNVISGTQAKQTSFYKYCYNSKSLLVFRTKKLRMLCICKISVSITNSYFICLLLLLLSFIYLFVCCLVFFALLLFSFQKNELIQNCSKTYSVIKKRLKNSLSVFIH